MANASADRSGKDSDTEYSETTDEKATLACGSRADAEESPCRAERSESSDDECENDDECSDVFGDDAPDAGRIHDARIAEMGKLHAHDVNGKHIEAE